MQNKKENKLFVVRKYIYASSASEVLKKEKTVPVDEIWVDDDWKKEHATKLAAMGFVDKKSK